MQISLWMGLLALTAGVRSAPGIDVPVPTDRAFAETWNREAFDHSLWSLALSKHVDERGLVDYAAIRKDAAYREYLYRLANTNPATLASDNERLAFWINAYNALVIQGVIEMLPEDHRAWQEFSVLYVTDPRVTQQGKWFFRALWFVVGGRRYALDEIEKGVLLRHPDWFKRDAAHYRSVGATSVDPRVHFALVCAARGCPKLLRKAYEPKRVAMQLDDAARRFVGDQDQARFDKSRRAMKLSPLLRWYGADFTNARHEPHAKSLAEFLSRYVDDKELARSLTSERWQTSYMTYDWKLNLQR